MKKILSISLIILLTSLVSVWAIRNHYISFNGKQYHTPLVDGNEELKKLYQQYMSSSMLSVAGTIQLLDEEQKNQLKEETSFESIKVGRSIYTRVSYLQTFINDSINVQLDTVNKTVIVAQNNQDLIRGMGQKIFPFEQLMSDTSTFKIIANVEDVGNERILILQNDLTPEVKSIKIYYNSSTYTLKRAEIEWWKGDHFEKADENKCWISRINYTGEGTLTRNIDNLLQSIIQIHANRVELTANYKNYSLQAMP